VALLLIFTTWHVSSYLITTYCSDSLITIVLISKLSAYMTRFLNLLQGLQIFTNLIMTLCLHKWQVDVAGEINAMGSGDVMSWQMKSG
jgi:hypothetical protein